MTLFHPSELELSATTNKVLKMVEEITVCMSFCVAAAARGGCRCARRSIPPADNVVMFRNFESFGQIRRAIAVTKKRSGEHELTLRELRMSSQGISISEPLHEFQGVLTGVPTYHGQGDPRNRP